MMCQKACEILRRNSPPGTKDGIPLAGTVHLPNGFSSIKLQAVDAAGSHFGQPGYETDLLYIACIVALVLWGTGPFSLNGLVHGRAKASKSKRSLPISYHRGGANHALEASRYKILQKSRDDGLV